ncbi:uncharacterized protein FA14DRAFT_178794 [Meira miltonrushii]|uniref:C3H1-type domain-containing protein n=1 Tax=Meira miltonrushii TaxID=1280837 RepID=A0A316VIU2_9BASI|nr:uncharacterized protein FA14DRAFT_178794 [Meira miltonrushii]PWN35425.1 hypothetical protein FA14DRAFT_178794 [Meira miltonrushii]
MPSFELKHTDELKIWLIKELEPICDADPEVLSDYVLALLKHDGSDETLQASLQEQLEDFLAEQTTPFVEKAFAALRSQSYLPESKQTIQASSSSAQDVSSTSVGTSRKRSADDEGRQSPAKTFRDGESGEGQRRDRRTPSDGNFRHDGNRQNRPRQMCRDFHQRGFCSRGDSCKFDHILPQQSTPDMNGYNMNPMMGMPPQHVNQAFGMPQNQHHGAPNNAFMGMGPQFAMGGHPMGWNGAQGGMTQQPPQELYQGPPPMDNAQNGVPQGDGNGLFARMDQNASNRGDFGHRGGRGARGGGRGGAHGGRGAFEKKQTSNTTLVIENVPVENLEMVKVNEYFKKFGTITNIQIDVDSKKALVSYSQPAEAKAAHSSPEVIFNNRFVKVYFQKLDEPLTKPVEHIAPTPKPASGPPLKSNFVPGQNKFVRPGFASEKVKEAQESAQKKLDELMSEQKEIMTKLTGGSATADEKKTLMARFGTLEGEIKRATEEVRAAVSGTTNGTSNTPSVSASHLQEQRDLKQREQLDRELEALKSGGGEGSTTEELKETLARLKAEAEQLGIDSETGTAGAEGGYRGGYRGRARGTPFRGSSRGFGYPSYRGGRGGAMVNRASMSLDNRPSKLHVTEIPDASNEEHRSKVKAFLQQFGETHSVEDKDDGSLLVHYKIRANGEQALRSGLSVPDVGSIKATWAKEGQSGTPAHAAGENEPSSYEGEGYEDEGDREESFRR